MKVRLALCALLEGGGVSSSYDAGVHRVASVAGYLAYGLMALTVCFGILTTTGWARRAVKRQTLYGGHLTLGVTTLAFGLLHGVAQTFQVDHHFSYLMVFVPLVDGGSSEVAMGIVGLELGVAVAVSIWFQRKLGYRRWRLVHYGGYAAFGLSLAHTVAASQQVRSVGGVGILVAAAATACLLLAILRLLPATTLVAVRVTPEEV